MSSHAVCLVSCDPINAGLLGAGSLALAFVYQLTIHSNGLPSAAAEFAR